MHFSIDRTVHTTAFDKPVVDHWFCVRETVVWLCVRETVVCVVCERQSFVLCVCVRDSRLCCVSV